MAILDSVLWFLWIGEKMLITHSQPVDTPLFCCDTLLTGVMPVTKKNFPLSLLEKQLVYVSGLVASSSYRITYRSDWAVRLPASDFYKASPWFLEILPLSSTDIYWTSTLKTTITWGIVLEEKVNNHNKRQNRDLK